jgi:adenylate kinase family enzyme
MYLIGVLMVSLPPPVFVLGAPRSGTSFLAGVLARHPEVLFFSELRVLELAALAGKQLLQSKGSEAHARELAFGKPYTTMLLEQLRAAKGARIVGDKFPPYAFQTHMLELLFPGCRFVHILRDGRDVAASWIAASAQLRGWRHKPVLPEVSWCALQWAGFVQAALTAAPDFKNRWYTLYYEKLVADPTREGKRLFEFIGVDWSLACESNVGRARADKSWTDTLSWAEQEVFRQTEAAEQLLHKLGYPPTPLHAELLDRAEDCLDAGDDCTNSQAERHYLRALRVADSQAGRLSVSGVGREAAGRLLRDGKLRGSVLAAWRLREQAWDARDPEAAGWLEDWLIQRGLPEEAALSLVRLVVASPPMYLPLEELPKAPVPLPAKTPGLGLLLASAESEAGVRVLQKLFAQHPKLKMVERDWLATAKLLFSETMLRMKHPDRPWDADKEGVEAVIGHYCATMFRVLGIGRVDVSLSYAQQPEETVRFFHEARGIVLGQTGPSNWLVVPPAGLLSDPAFWLQRICTVFGVSVDTSMVEAFLELREELQQLQKKTEPSPEPVDPWVLALEQAPLKNLALGVPRRSKSWEVRAALARRLVREGLDREAAEIVAEVEHTEWY